MAQYSLRQRQEWIAWHDAHGRNVTLTSRHFGISRATFYRWLQRYDPSTPQRALRSRSRRPRTKRCPTWSTEQLVVLSDLVRQDPCLGRGRLRALLLERYNWQWSEATIGRMLQKIRDKCPVCKRRGGLHDELQHLLQADLRRHGVDLVAAAEARRQQQAQHKKEAAGEVAEKEAAVKAAIQIARRGRGA